MDIFLENISLMNLKVMAIHNFDLLAIFGKGGQRKMMKIRLKKSPKSWIWDQYLPENMK